MHDSQLPRITDVLAQVSKRAELHSTSSDGDGKGSGIDSAFLPLPLFTLLFT